MVLQSSDSSVVKVFLYHVGQFTPHLYYVFTLRFVVVGRIFALCCASCWGNPIGTLALEYFME